MKKTLSNLVGIITANRRNIVVTSLCAALLVVSFTACCSIEAPYEIGDSPGSSAVTTSSATTTQGTQGTSVPSDEGTQTTDVIATSSTTATTTEAEVTTTQATTTTKPVATKATTTTTTKKPTTTTKPNGTTGTTLDYSDPETQASLLIDKIGGEENLNKVKNCAKCGHAKNTHHHRWTVDKNCPDCGTFVPALACHVCGE